MWSYSKNSLCWPENLWKLIICFITRVSDARQRQVFAQIGIKHDYNYPYPFWFFLGKMVSQALFEKETSLDILSFTRVNDREFVGFENKDFHKDNSSNGIKVIEVNLKRPHPNEPVEIFWRPARGIIVQRLRECESRILNCQKLS